MVQHLMPIQLIEEHKHFMPVLLILITGHLMVMMKTVIPQEPSQVMKPHYRLVMQLKLVIPIFILAQMLN